MKTAIWLIFSIAAIYLMLGAFLYVFQSTLLFFPTRTLIAHPGDIGLEYEDVFLETTDGERLHGWYIPRNDSRGTLLFFHGNAGNISGRLESIRQFHEMQLNVFIIDYRGYGQSTGRPTEQGLYNDALAAYTWLTDERGIPADSLVVFGRSLGGSVAAWLASEKPVAALILESAFTSVPDVAMTIYPVYPVKWMARFELPTLDYVKKYDGPLLVAHSPHDDIISYRFGREIYDAASEPKQFLEMLGGHNNGFYVTGLAYGEGYREFFDSIFNGRGPADSPGEAGNPDPAGSSGQAGAPE